MRRKTALPRAGIPEPPPVGTEDSRGRSQGGGPASFSADDAKLFDLVVDRAKRLQQALRQMSIHIGCVKPARGSHGQCAPCPALASQSPYPGAVGRGVLGMDESRSKRPVVARGNV